jgi:hypothetical protein
MHGMTHIKILPVCQLTEFIGDQTGVLAATEAYIKHTNSGVDTDNSTEEE